LGASKHRTRCGDLVEQILKFLIDLDGVISEGNEMIRSERKKLVLKINEELLPAADQNLKKAQALMKFQTVLDDRYNEKKKEWDALQDDADEYKSCQQSDIECDSKSDIEDECDRKSDIEDECDNESPHEMTDDQEVKESEQNSASDPKFQVSETKSCALIKVELPCDRMGRCVPLEYVNVEVSRDRGALVVEGPRADGTRFELAFQVPVREFAISETIYQTQHGVLVLTVPRRRRNMVKKMYPRHMNQGIYGHGGAGRAMPFFNRRRNMCVF
jgi:hypothetical protein